MAEKIVNYTPAQTTLMLEAYAAGTTVEALAEEMGKTVRSIVAKLSREGVYQKKAYVSKAGTVPIKKDTVADELGALCGLSEGETDSLTKANKTALLKILAMVKGELPPPPEFIKA